MRLSYCFVILLVLTHANGLAGKSGSSTGPTVGSGKNYVRSGQQNSQTNDRSSESTAKVRRGAGISAWGIVALIISVILCSMGGYYFFIFYPMLCKRKDSYDLMELSV